MTRTSTILIVDDELGGRKTLELMLRPFGYDLVVATLARCAPMPPGVGIPITVNLRAISMTVSREL